MDGELVAGDRVTDLGHLNGRRDGRTQGGAGRGTLEYLVRLTGERPVLSLVVHSEKGGTARETIPLSR